MRLDQLTDGLGSNKTSILCQTLKSFQEDIYAFYVNSSGHDVVTLWKNPLVVPGGLLLEYCEASPEFVELFSIWSVGTEEVCTELVKLLALALSVGRHDALTSATKRVLKDRITDIYANIIDWNSPLACPGLRLFSAISKQGLIATSTLLNNIKGQLKNILKSITVSHQKRGGEKNIGKQQKVVRSGSNWMVRLEGVRFMLSLLRCGAPDIQQEMLEHKGFVHCLITGLPMDHVFSVHETLSTLKAHVLNSAKLPRTVKKRVFGAMMIRTLLELICNNHCKDYEYVLHPLPLRQQKEGASSDNKKPGSRSTASRYGREALQNILCGDGKHFFSHFGANRDTTEFSANGGSNLTTCSPLLLEVMMAFAPLRFDDHRVILLEILKTHPMAIESYAGRLPFSIEPSQDASWFAAIALLKNIFEVKNAIALFHQVLCTAKKNEGGIPGNFFKFLVPLDSLRVVLGRGVLHSSDDVCYGSLRLLETVLNRIDQCCSSESVSDRVNTHSIISAALQTKLRARMPTFDVLLRKFVQLEKTEKKDRNDELHAMTRESVLVCLQLYIKHLPASASDSEFDASRLLETISKNQAGADIDEALLRVVNEAALHNLYGWNRFLKDNGTRSSLRLVLECMTNATSHSTRAFANTVIVNSLYGVGLFKFTRSSTTSRDRRTSLELLAWLTGIGPSIVSLFDQCLCSIVKHPIQSTLWSTTSIGQASALTMYMFQMLHQISTGGARSIKTEDAVDLVSYICQSVGALGVTCFPPWQLNDNFLSVISHFEKSDVNAALIIPLRVYCHGLRRYKFVEHIPSFLSLSRQHGDAGRNKPFLLELPPEKLSIVRFCDLCDQAVREWRGDRSPCEFVGKYHSVADKVLMAYLEYVQTNRSCDRSYASHRFLRLLSFSFQVSLFDIPIVRESLDNQHDFSLIVDLFGHSNAGTLLLDAVFRDETADHPSKLRPPIAEKACRNFISKCFDVHESRNTPGAICVIFHCIVHFANTFVAAKKEDTYTADVLSFLFELFHSSLSDCDDADAVHTWENILSRLMSKVPWFFQPELTNLELIIKQKFCHSISLHGPETDISLVVEFREKIANYIERVVEGEKYSDAEDFLFAEKISYYSEICDFLGVDINRSLAKKLVKKLKRGTSVSKLYRKLLALVVTGACRSLDSSGAHVNLELLETCTELNCVSNDVALDEACMVLVKHLASVEAKDFLHHVYCEFFSIWWQNCNKIRAKVLGFLVNRFQTYFSSAQQLLKASEQHNHPYEYWIIRLPILYSMVSSQAVMDGAPIELMQQETMNCIFTALNAYPPVLPSSTADLACCVYRAWWGLKVKSGRFEAFEVSSPDRVFTSTFGIISDITHSKKKSCGVPLTLVVQCIVFRCLDRTGSKFRRAVLQTLIMGMEQIVLLGSSTKMMPRKLWIQTITTCLDYVPGVFQRPDDHGSDGNKLLSVYPKFVKACLKHGYGSVEMMRMLKTVVDHVYDDKTILNSEFNPTKCFDMLTGHSKFLATLDHPRATWLLDLMFALAQSDKACVDISRAKVVFPILLKSYTASLGERDKAICKILLHHARSFPENNFLKYVNYAWGDALLLQRSIVADDVPTTEDSTTSLSQSNWIFNDATCLDAVRLRYTNERYPVSRGAFTNFVDEGRKDSNTDADRMYDPTYVLPAIRHAIDLNNARIGLKKLFSSHILSLVACSLSSSCSFIRSHAYAAMAKVYAKLEYHKVKNAHNMKDSFPQGQEIGNILRCLKYAITEKEQQLPGIICTFVSEGLHIAQRPNHCVYPLLNKFLLSRPCLDISDIPMYYVLFNSGTPSYRMERMWILRTIGNGGRSELDLSLLSRRHVYASLLALSTSTMSDDITEPVILNCIRQISLAPGSSKELIRCGYVHWLQRLALRKNNKHVAYVIDIFYTLLRPKALEGTDAEKKCLFVTSTIVSILFLLQETSQQLSVASELRKKRDTAANCEKLLQLCVHSMELGNEILGAEKVSRLSLSFREFFLLIQLSDEPNMSGKVSFRRNLLELIMLSMPTITVVEAEYLDVFSWCFSNLKDFFDDSRILRKFFGANMIRMLSSLPLLVLEHLRSSWCCRDAAFSLQKSLFDPKDLVPSICSWKSDTIRVHDQLNDLDDSWGAAYESTLMITAEAEGNTEISTELADEGGQTNSKLELKKRKTRKDSGVAMKKAKKSPSLAPDGSMTKPLRRSKRRRT